MRSILRVLTLVLAVAAAPTAHAGSKLQEQGEAKLAQALEGRVAGQPLTCIDPRNVEVVEIFEQTAIIYRMPGGGLYLNRPQAGARTLERDSTISTKTFGPRLCSHDAATVSGYGSTGFLMLGPFVPYSKPTR